MSQNFKNKRNFSDNAKLSIQGEAWQSDTPWKRPTLKLRVVNGNTRITVYLNHPDESKPNYVTANMDPIIGNIFVNLLEEAATTENFEAMGIENLNKQRGKDGKAMGKMETFSKVLVGRDGEGVVCIKVQCREYPEEFVFRVMPGFAYKLIDANGKPVAPAKSSKRVVMGYVQAMRNILAPLLIRTGEEFDAQKEKQGGQGGGWNKGGNSGGGNWNKGNNSGGGQSGGWNKKKEASNDSWGGDDVTDVFA